MKYSYHTDLLIKFQLGLLEKDALQTIPSSTLHNWKSRDLTKLIGADKDLITDENLEMMRDYLSRKKLLAAGKALWRIYTVIMTVLNFVYGKTAALRKAKDCIIETIEQVAPVLGMDRCRRLIPIVDDFPKSTMRYIPHRHRFTERKIRKPVRVWYIGITRNQYYYWKQQVSCHASALLYVFKNIPISFSNRRIRL